MDVILILHLHRRPIHNAGIPQITTTTITATTIPIRLHLPVFPTAEVTVHPVAVRVVIVHRVAEAAVQEAADNTLSNLQHPYIIPKSHFIQI